MCRLVFPTSLCLLLEAANTNTSASANTNTNTNCSTAAAVGPAGTAGVPAAAINKHEQVQRVWGGGGAYESAQECMNEHRGIRMSAGSTSEHGAAAGATCPRLSSLSPSHQFIIYYLFIM